MTRRFPAWKAILPLAAWLAAALVFAVSGRAQTNEQVYVISLQENITRNTVYLVRRAMQEVAAERPQAVILDMDTYGGYVAAMEQVMRLLERSPVKTCTYVNRKAYSAGALIAAATDVIYMAPGSVIGAATPVVAAPGGPSDVPSDYQEKISSAMRALVRTTAQEKGHNPDVFEAMIDRDIELEMDGTLISPKGKLLTLTNTDAAKQYGEPPRPLLSAGTIETLEEAIAQLGLSAAQLKRIEPHGFEVLARWIEPIAPLLIMIGLLAIYLELSTPGIGVPAIVAGVCFVLFFMAHFIAGLAGWEEAALFAIGVTLLVIELFVLPGFGVAGLLGIGAILAALVMAMVERWPDGPTLPSWPQLQVPLLKVTVGFVGALVGVLIVGRFVPKTSLFKKLELSASTSSGEGYTAARDEQYAGLVGASGVADTMLRPAGKGRFGERFLDVVTEGDLIERGTPIRVVRVEGSRVIVGRAG
jgi:membrane-bound serine protease (ClpP class)